MDAMTTDDPVVTAISAPGSLWETAWEYLTGSEVREPESPPGPFAADPRLLAPPAGEGLHVCWIGHSTVLIDIDGMRFLTDPIWSRRCSPFSMIGPRRFFEPPLALDDLRHVDGVVISHDHYDHLDQATIRRLADTGWMFYLPRGVGRYLRGWGVADKNIREMDWWEQVSAGAGHRLTALPARHFSGRGLWARNRTRWASWAIQGPVHRVYFGGDGGLFPAMATIGRRCGPFDLTLLEIGAYHRNWSEIHMGPQNAVAAHRALDGRVLMPIHWGTFKLALHDWRAPAEEVIRHAAAARTRLLLPVPGRLNAVPARARVSRWW